MKERIKGDSNENWNQIRNVSDINAQMKDKENYVFIKELKSYQLSEWLFSDSLIQ